MAADEGDLGEDSAVRGVANVTLKPGPGKLIGHGYPVQARPSIVDGWPRMHGVVTQALPIGPGARNGREDPDAAMTGTAKIIDERRHVLVEHELVADLVVEPEAADCGAVSEPRLAALNRRNELPGDHAEALVRHGGLQGAKRRLNDRGVTPITMGANAVGLDEGDDNVGIGQLGQRLRASITGCQTSAEALHLGVARYPTLDLLAYQPD